MARRCGTIAPMDLIVKERDRLLQRTARVYGLGFTIVSLVCLSLPGALDFIPYLLCVPLYVGIAFCQVQLGTSRSIAWVIAILVCRDRGAAPDHARQRGWPWPGRHLRDQPAHRGFAGVGRGDADQRPWPPRAARARLGGRDGAHRVAAHPEAGTAAHGRAGDPRLDARHGRRILDLGGGAARRAAHREHRPGAPGRAAGQRDGGAAAPVRAAAARHRARDPHPPRALRCRRRAGGTSPADRGRRAPAPAAPAGRDTDPALIRAATTSSRSRRPCSAPPSSR